MRGGGFIAGVKDELLCLGDIEEEVIGDHWVKSATGCWYVLTESLSVRRASMAASSEYFVMEEGLRQSTV